MSGTYLIEIRSNNSGTILVTTFSEYSYGVKPLNREIIMKTLARLTLVMSLLCSMTMLAKKQVIELNGETVNNLDQVTCKQAYEKARGKKHHKKLFHKESTRNRASKQLNINVTKDDVERAIEYGYRTGAYCKGGKLLNVKDFKQVTISQIEALKASDKLGTKLESLETGTDNMSCEDFIKMAKSNKKDDGLNRTVTILNNDLHNIHSARTKDRDSVELQTKAELKMEKKKDKYLRRVQRKAVDELDDDSISMADVNKAFDGAVTDGSACADKKVLNRRQMKELLVHRLSDKSQRAESVNSESASLMNDIRIYFNNGGDQSVEMQEMVEGSDA